MLALLTPTICHSEDDLQGNAEDTARKAYVDSFSKFSQEHNVMAKPQKPDGTKAPGGPKHRFDQDDGNPYESDLTYHDMPYIFSEKIPDPADPSKEKSIQLRPFVSPHGALSKTGGSSVLERAARHLTEAKKFEEQDANKTPEQLAKEAEQTGVRYSSLYKINTQEVKQKPQTGTPGTPPKPGEESDKVERWEVREESNPQIEQVGTDSGDSIIRCCPRRGKQNDSNALPSSVVSPFRRS